MSRKPNPAARAAAVLGVAVGGAALAAAALYTEVMTSVIARRRNASTDALVEAVKGPAAPIDPIHEENAKALRETPMETVAIRSHDGYVLRARWYPAEGGAAAAARTVMLVHGWHSRWSLDFSASAPFLHGAGCNLLLIDQRCHGESGGNLISYGIRERYDVLSWLDWLEQQDLGLPVYLCGISMGAATVLMAAGLPLKGRVAGILADCGYSTPDEIIRLTLEKSIGKLTAPTMAAVNLNCKLKDGFSFGDYTPIEAMAHNTDVPCLFVHGDADDFVPWRMSLENYYACRAPKELLIVHGAGHGLSFVVDPDTYQKKVLDFFAAYDPEPTPPAPKQRRRKRRAAATEASA